MKARWRRARRKFLVRTEKTRRAFRRNGVEGTVRKCWGKAWLWSKGHGATLATVAVLSTLAGGGLSWYFWAEIWCWLGSGGTATNAETLRNLALGGGAGLAAVIGIPLAIWRSWAAERQTRIANEQARTSEHGLNNERYQKGAEMLGSATLATRIGGISALERLARERPDDYHIQIAKLLCAFIRHPTEHDQPETEAANGEAVKKFCSPAVEMAAQVLGKRSEKQIEIEQREEFRLGLWGADLSDALLYRADLSGASLYRADLSGATLDEADLSRTILGEADLSGALLYDTNLSGASLSGANISGAQMDRTDLSDAFLSGADLSGALLIEVDFLGARLRDINLSDAKLNGVKNLTKRRLDATFIWEGCQPPRLKNSVDPDTGEPLKWDGEVRPRPDPASSEA